jgi:hypothetical protein
MGWWGHILVVFGFLNYLPYSKHFHIIMAFPNTYYSNLNNKGAFNNLSSVKEEVLKMFDPNFDPYATPSQGEAPVPDRFGAKDVEDLTWKSLWMLTLVRNVVVVLLHVRQVKLVNY